MPNLPTSSVAWGAGIVATLFVVYVGLITTVMSYASLTVDYAQSIKSHESELATLEAAYLAHVNDLTHTNISALGYRAPTAKNYVPARSATALR